MSDDYKKKKEIKIYSVSIFFKKIKNKTSSNFVSMAVRRGLLYLKSEFSNFFNKKSFFRYKCTIIAHKKMKK